MLDHESNTARVSRWFETYHLLVGVSCPDPAYALEPAPTGCNEGTRVATGNDPAVLIAEAETAGAGRSALAVVSPIRPELLLVDLDLCANEVLSAVITAATATGAVLAYVAASGSPNSLHVAFAVTPSGRLLAAAAVEAVRRAQRMSAKAVDIPTPRRYVRLPGSASLKGAGVCWPVTVEGNRLTAIATAERLRAALATVEDEWSAHDVAAHYVPDTASTPQAAANTNSTTAPPLDADDGQVDAMRLSATDVEAPYAWKPRRSLTDDEAKLLNSSVAVGKRSDVATEAARVLIGALNIRSWRTAKYYYDRYPVFAKFRERDQEDRAKGRHHSAENPSLSFTHWSSVIGPFRNHRADVADEDQAVIDSALLEVACWDDADLVAAAVAVIHHRYSDGHGIADRPISTRCLAAWLNVDHTTAGRRIKGLIERGLLELVIPHNRYTARQEAHRYRLRRPSRNYRTDLRHELTSPRSLTHPLWGDLSQKCRHAWEKLSATGLSTSQVAALIGQPHGTASHGTKKLLDALTRAGLATQHGRGRGTTWTLGSATLDEAAERFGTVARHRLLLATINVEREAWHTTNPRTRTAARTRLAYLHKRQHASAQIPSQGQLVLFGSRSFADDYSHDYSGDGPVHLGYSRRSGPPESNAHQEGRGPGRRRRAGPSDAE
ncbi:hypothetical protein ACQ7HM_20995 [Williamsia sp. MIQD14]|uniref:hypothetical protein n=1 Tax=Williamsia sp. MIQD14 TaxID=3425703 RepID=UPI003DA0A022